MEGVLKMTQKALVDSLVGRFDIQYETTKNVPVLSRCPLHTSSGCGKQRHTLIGLW